MSDNKPQIFNTLYKIDVGDYIKEKNGFDYLPWARAWKVVKDNFPTATYAFARFGEENSLFNFIEGYGSDVMVSVTIDDQTHTMTLPILNLRNQPVLDYPTSDEVNRAVMRCFTKAIAMHGLGLGLYEGEDVPDSDGFGSKNRSSKSTKKSTKKSGGSTKKNAGSTKKSGSSKKKTSSKKKAPEAEPEEEAPTKQSSTKKGSSKKKSGASKKKTSSKKKSSKKDESTTEESGTTKKSTKKSGSSKKKSSGSSKKKSTGSSKKKSTSSKKKASPKPDEPEQTPPWDDDDFDRDVVGYLQEATSSAEVSERLIELRKESDNQAQFMKKYMKVANEIIEALDE